jgi:hypothetical protein
MQTDEDLAALFERAVTDLTPDVSAMVRRAEQLGRKLRRRRRIRLATGSGLTVIAVVAAGFGALLTHPFAALGGHASPRAATVGMASAVGAHATKGPAVYPRVRASASAGQQQAVGAQSAAANPMTPRQMLRVLRGMLPAGAVLTKDPTASNGRGALEVNYNDGQGMVDIMIDIIPFDAVVTDQQLQTAGPPVGADSKPLPYVQALSCPNPLWTDEGQRPAGALPISCALRTPPGGGTERDAVMYADSYGFYGYGIYDQRPDGIQVFIQVANGYFDPYLPHVDRAVPPGSMSLWESVAESPAWHG